MLQGLPVEIIPGLHEHERSRSPWSTQAAFEAAVQACLNRPGELVYGDETADQAYTRFATAVDHFLARHAGQTVAVVAHGTVISLFVSRRCGLEPFSLWRRLGLPALVSVVMAFLFFNGFFVALEYAIVSLRRTKVDELVRERRRGAPAVKFAKENLDDCVASTQLGTAV